MASDSSKKRPSTSGRRRIKCTHPKCGKYGHFTSQCWVANPQLRFRGTSSRDKGGQSLEWDPPYDSSNEATNGTCRWQNDWETNMTYALPEITLPPVVLPFPFLELPQEVQYKIYEHVYEEKHSVRVFMTELTTSNPEHYIPYDCSELVVRGYDYETLAQVSKKIREDSRKARQRSFNGQMKIFWHKDSGSAPLWKICEPRWARLRSRIISLAICSVSGRNTGHDFSVWKRIPTFFPRVAELNIHYNAYRRMPKDRYSPWLLTTAEYKRDLYEAFRNIFVSGQMDGDFRYPSEVLELPILASAMEEASRSCNMSLNTAIHWNNHCGRHEISQYIIFHITTDGLSEAVERTWGAV